MDTNKMAAVAGTIGVAMILAVLFGLIISQLLTTDSIVDITLDGTVTNETGAFINVTTYTVDSSTAEDFAALTLTAMYNATDDTVIGVGNATVSGSGFTNATVTNWDDVLVSYTYTYTGADPSSPVTVSNVETTFSAFIVALTALFAVGGTILGVLWLMQYIRPLLKKNRGSEIGL